MIELLLIGLALFERLVVDFGPNIELVTTATILAGLYLSKKASWIVPLVIMVVSDAYLGFGLISLFTWSGFMLMGWLPRVLLVGRSNLVRGTMAALAGNTGFFLWTNFGVWLTDRWGMYASDLSGLGLALVNGLPFYKMQLMSSWMFVPSAIMVVEWILIPGWRWIRKDNSNQLTNQAF